MMTTDRLHALRQLARGDGMPTIAELITALQDVLDALQEQAAELDRLKVALREAILSTHRVTRRCVEHDPAGSTFEIDWTPEVRRWAVLCGLDLEGRDPN